MCSSNRGLNGEAAKHLVLRVKFLEPTCLATCDQRVYKENSILYGPAKAANAGGFAVSALEMRAKTAPPFMDEVDGRLKEDIMTNIFNTAKTTAETTGLGKDYLRVLTSQPLIANAMIAQVLFNLILCHTW